MIILLKDIKNNNQRNNCFSFVLNDKFKHLNSNCSYVMNTTIKLKMHLHHSFPFSPTLIQRVRTLFFTKNWRTFKDIFPIFQGLHWAQKRVAWSLVLPQHVQFYPEGLSVFASLLLQFLGWIKLALKLMDFLAPTAIFKDFQGACKPFIQ